MREAFLVWPYAAGIGWLLRRFTRAARPRRRRAAAAADPGRAVLAAAAARRRCPSRRSRAPGAPARSIAWPRCSIGRAGAADRSSPTPTTAPELLYRTPHSVLSIPNHRPQPGFARDLAHPDRDRRGRRAGRARPASASTGSCCARARPNGRCSPCRRRARPTLYQRLADGQAPSWLRPLPLEGDLAAEARLFEVIRPSDADGRDRPRRRSEPAMTGPNADHPDPLLQRSGERSASRSRACRARCPASRASSG